MTLENTPAEFAGQELEANRSFAVLAANGIQCRCSAVRGRLKDDANYACPRCSAPPEPEAQDSKELLLGDSVIWR